MQLIDETEYSLSECAKMTGSESTSAARVRKYRSKEALQCNTDVTGCNEVKQICNGEIEIEKEIELDKEKDNKNISLCKTSSAQLPVSHKESEKVHPVRCAFWEREYVVRNNCDE